MSLRDQIVSLEALAAVDGELRRLDEQIADERGILTNLKTELRQLDEKLAADRASVAEMDRARNDLVGEVRQMTAQIERSREKLSRSRNERESNAAQREVEELRKLQRDREDESAKLATLSDAARKTIEETETQQKKIADELGGRESDITKTLAAAVAEREERLADRARLASAVQSLTLRRYEQVRKRKGSAIAKTIDGTCLACHMRLPPMLFQKLLRGEVFEQCPSCARILYYEAPAAPPGGELKSCPTCRRLYPDDAGFCPVDGVALLRSTDVPVAGSDADPRVGTLLCMRYQVRRVVADGGMGRVYEALDMHDKSRVAIKILHAEFAEDEIAVERFKREFEVSKLLPHDHIVDVRDFRETEDKSYALAMEYLEGEELRMLLKREKVLAPARLVRMLSQVAIGLDEAHSRQLVHRDLKPDNIFLCGTREGDNVKILDFGSVKDKSSMAKKLTVVGTTIGSPFYMAPEQAQGLDTLDARADVWALAAITYECLTGTVPFQGVNGPSILLAILTKDPIPPSVAGQGQTTAIPAAIDDVIESALAKNPNIRTKTIGAFADAVGHAYGLGGAHQQWAGASQAELTQQIQSHLARPMATASAGVASMVDPFSTRANERRDEPSLAGAPAVASAARGASSRAFDEPMGMPRPQPKWLVPALVASVAVVLGIVAALIFFA